jgi:hypothetical protein
MASGSRARWRRAAPVLLGTACVLAFAGAAGAAPTHAAARSAQEVTTSSAAPLVASPPVRLLHQSPVVRAPSGLLGLSLTRTGPAAAQGATVTVYLFSRLTTRSGLDAALGSPGPSGAISATPALPATCLASGAELRVAVAVAPDGVAVAPRTLCGHPAPVLRLACASGCDGVYPVRVVVRGAGTAAALTSLVTFAHRSTSPLRVAWVLRVAGLSGALGLAAPALAGLVAHPKVNATVDVQGVAVANGLASGGADLAVLRAATAARAHELICEPYVPADLGALRASGLQTEVIRQFALNDVVLKSAGVARIPTPTATNANGPATPTMAEAVASVRVRHLLVDGTSLTTDPSSTLSWGGAFTLSGASPSPTALATDTPLDALSSSTAADPGLTAAQFLGELAFLHFEQPNLPDARVAAVLTPATRDVTTSFVAQVLVGLGASPVLRAVTTSGAFRQAPVGANGFPTERSFVLPASEPFRVPTINKIKFLRITTDALSSAVKAGATPIPSIEGELLTAERVLPNAARTAILDNVHYRLKQELGHFHIDGGTITLTESSGSLPITILSNAPYVVSGTLLFQSSRLTFPDGASRADVLVTPPVRSVHVSADAATSGDLPLYVLFVSPDRRIVLARAQIVVRATPTSIVGIALTVGAVLVLLLWWARTSMRRRRQRG